MTRYFITGGGTGGHIYPAIAIADYLKDDGEIFYVGNPRNLEFDIVKQKGYKFLGWTLGDSEEVVIFPYVVKSTDEDIVFKAKYSLCVYDINYMLFGGENNSNNPLSYTVEDERELFIPTRKGYRFDGWFLDENFNTQITRISGGTGNITLYAKWTVDKYSIIYNPSTSGSMDSILSLPRTASIRLSDIEAPTKRLSFRESTRTRM